MARHEYVSYRLINPIITNWGGNKIDYSQNVAHNFDVKLAYEAVHYDTGFVDSGQIEGFGSVHYDWVPSPLSSSYPRNVSTSPSFSRSSGLVSNDSVASATVTKTASTSAVNSLLYQTVGTSTSGVNIPQAGLSSATTVATQSSTTSSAATVTATGTTPDYLR